MDERAAPAPKVFISYRREDSAGHAGRLFDAIAARFGDDHVFMDVDLGPGVDFENRITQTIGQSDVLVVVIGPKWATVARDENRPRLFEPRDYVRLEVETALARPEVRVIPVLVAGAQMPSAEQLPESLRPLRRRNALELSDPRWRYDTGRLVNSLAEQLGEPRPLQSRPERAAPRRRTWLMGAAGLAVVVIVAVLAATGAFSSGGGGGSGSGGSGGGTGVGTTASPAAGSNVSPPGADGAARAYETAYEAKDLSTLRKLLDPNVVLKKGSSSQWNGVDNVIAEYRREFKNFGKRQPGFDFDVGGSDQQEQKDEIHGPYRITSNGAVEKTGAFGVQALTFGSRTTIKELCFDCPDLRHPGGFIAA
jgi:TIR domain-containing protein